MEEEIDSFTSMFTSYAKLLDMYENYYEFWIVANKVMIELNKEFKVLEIEKKKCFDEDKA